MTDAADLIDGLRKRLALALRHPTAIFAAILLGGFYGWVDKGGTPLVNLLGDVYLRLLQMCVIPLLFTAVVTSLSKLFSDGAASRYIGRLVLLFAGGLLIASGLGVVLGQLGQPGTALQQQAREIIGEVIFRAEARTFNGEVADNPTGIVDIAVGIVPANIFVALTSGDMLAILFFAILFGVALGSLARQKSEGAIAVFECLYETFIKIIVWLMYVLPFGLFCLAYSQVSSVGVDVLVALIGLVLFIYGGCIALIIFYSLIIWSRVGGGYWQSVAALRETMFVAFGTASSFATVPTALRCLKEGLKLDRSVVDLVMPLGVTLNPPATVFYFAIVTLFISNLYGVHLDFGQIAFVIVASVLAGVAASGAPGVAGLWMISLILVPLGLPVEVAIIVLLAIDPIVDPILTVMNIGANSATTSILGAPVESAEVIPETTDPGPAAGTHLPAE